MVPAMTTPRTTVTEDYRNWDEDLVDDVPTVQMGPGTHDDRLAEAADQLAGLLEFTFGHGVWEDAREVAYTALESCRTALRGAIVGARAAAVEVQARGLDDVAELWASVEADLSDRADHAAEVRERVTSAVMHLSGLLRPDTTDEALAVMVQAAEAMSTGQLPGVVEALTAERDRLAAAVQKLRPLVTVESTYQELCGVVSAAEMFGGQALPGVADALLDVRAGLPGKRAAASSWR